MRADSSKGGQKHGVPVGEGLSKNLQVGGILDAEKNDVITYRQQVDAKEIKEKGGMVTHALRLRKTEGPEAQIDVHQGGRKKSSG